MDREDQKDNIGATKMTKKDFEKIEEGDTVFFGDSQHGKVHLVLTDSVTIVGLGSEQIYRDELRHPFVIHNIQKINAEQKVTAEAPVYKPKVKVKDPETIKLEALLRRFPQDEGLIMSQALTGNFTVEEIEGEVIMLNAGIRHRNKNIMSTGG